MADARLAPTHQVCASGLGCCGTGCGLLWNWMWFIIELGVGLLWSWMWVIIELGVGCRGAGLLWSWMWVIIELGGLSWGWVWSHHEAGCVWAVMELGVKSAQ